MTPFFIVRIVLSLIILTIVHVLSPDNLLYPIILTFVLDYLDNPYHFVNVPYSGETFTYQKYDKVCDILTYGYIIFLYKDLMTAQFWNILVVLFTWRLIGVLLFFMTNQTQYLCIFFDGLNMSLILYYLMSDECKKNTQQLYMIMIMGCIVKIFYEQLHHGNRENYRES